ncbi:hypothetical protein ACLBV5_14755 [Brevundimonas sp. M1A4_2e]
MTQGQTARRPTRGVRNNNPGNIRRVSGVTWQGQAKDQTDAEFVVYVSPEMGVRALVRTLLTYNNAHKLGVEAGKILAPAVGAAATVLESVSNWMSRAGESESFLAKTAVWAVAGLAGAVGNAVVGILGPLFMAKTMLGPGGLGGAAFKTGATQVIGLFGRMRLAAIGFNLSTLANPVVLIGAAAVAAVVGVGLGRPQVLGAHQGFFGGVGQALGKAFAPALSAIGSMLAPLKPLWDGFADGVGKVAGWFGRLLTPVDAADKSVTSAAEAGRKFGRVLAIAFKLSPVGLFVAGIRMGIPNIRAVLAWRPMDTIRAAWSGLTGFFGGLQARFSGWGGMILQSLINGIRSMTGSVKNAVMETASPAVGWFKSGLGIRSPSRVFMGSGRRHHRGPDPRPGSRRPDGGSPRRGHRRGRGRRHACGGRRLARHRPAGRLVNVRRLGRSRRAAHGRRPYRNPDHPRLGPERRRPDHGPPDRPRHRCRAAAPTARRGLIHHRSYDPGRNPLLHGGGLLSPALADAGNPRRSHGPRGR